MTSQKRPYPAVGQVWADCDKRVPGRTIRVEEVQAEHVICTILTNDHPTQQRLDAGTAWQRDMRGKRTRIAIKRMRPTSTGYRLLDAASPQASESRG